MKAFHMLTCSGDMSTYAQVYIDIPTNLAILIMLLHTLQNFSFLVAQQWFAFI